MRKKGKYFREKRGTYNLPSNEKANQKKEYFETLLLVMSGHNTASQIIKYYEIQNKVISNSAITNRKELLKNQGFIFEEMSAVIPRTKLLMPNWAKIIGVIIKVLEEDIKYKKMQYFDLLNACKKINKDILTKLKMLNFDINNPKEYKELQERINKFKLEQDNTYTDDKNSIRIFNLLINYSKNHKFIESYKKSRNSLIDLYKMTFDMFKRFINKSAVQEVVQEVLRPRINSLLYSDSCKKFKTFEDAIRGLIRMIGSNVVMNDKRNWKSKPNFDKPLNTKSHGIDPTYDLIWFTFSQSARSYYEWEHFVPEINTLNEDYNFIYQEEEVMPQAG